MRSFWKIESSGTLSLPLLSKLDSVVLESTASSLTYCPDGHYSVGIPWKDSVSVLYDNYQMALKRLKNTEKRLKNNPEVGNAYRETIERYIDKGYVHTVSETDQETKWLLLHFPVIQPERETT